MHVPFRSPLSPSLVAIALAVVVAGCSDAPTTTAVDGIQMAKGGGKGPTVEATDPTGAHQDTTLNVRVLGSGFEEGSDVKLLLQRKETGKVRTISVRFVGPRELVARVTIDLDADIALYDVQVIGPGGKKGIGTELFAVQKKKPAVPVTLEEYWVFPDPDPNVTDGNLIHAAGTGPVDHVIAGSVIFDYFFNGLRDLSLHFEYAYTVGIGPTATTTSDGTWHVDIPWNGERAVGPYPDMLLTDGPDPFVLGIYPTVNGELVGGTGWRGGIIDDGALIGGSVGNVNSDEHGPQSVTSYVLFQGSPAQGVLYLKEVSIGSATCAAVSTGRGKKSARKQVRRVSVDYTIEFGAKDSDGSEITIPIPSDIPNDQYAWVGFHLRDGDSGYLSDHLWVRPIQAQVSGSFTMDLPDGEHNFMLEFLVDYVNPTGAFANYAYDPGANRVTTTVGFDGIRWFNGASTTVNDGNFPVGKTESFAVTCN